MAGTVIPLWTARDFDYSSIGIGSTEEHTLVKALDLSPYRDARLLVRVHTINVTAGTLVVRAYRTSPTPEHPSADFLDAASPLATASIQSAAVGDLVRQSLSASHGAFVRFTIRATQPGETQETIEARLSAGVAVRI